MQLRLELRGRPHRRVAPAGYGPRDDLVWRDTVSRGKDPSDAGLVERCLRLNVSRRSCLEPQLLDKGPRSHGQRVIDQELLLLAGPVVKLQRDRVTVGLGHALDNTRLDLPGVFLTDGGLESRGECLVAVGVDCDVVAELCRICESQSAKFLCASVSTSLGPVKKISGAT